jgi:NADH-quinone oxidoreductase subunit D
MVQSLTVTTSTLFEAPDALGRTQQAQELLGKQGIANPGIHVPSSELLGETMSLNFGPSHPSTHGVFRIMLDLDGELITKATPEVGYLHRGDEKIAENMQYNQFVPYTDRLDYLAPLANNVAYALAVEKLMGWELPARGKAIRVICCELARISAHLLGLGASSMDVGAISVFLYTFTEREKIYNLCELLTGARFTTSFTRVGGQVRDLPDAFPAMLRAFLDSFPIALDEITNLLTRNPIFIDRTKNVGIIAREDAIAYGLTGPMLRGSGVDYDVRKAHPYLDYEKYDFEIPIGTVGDCYDRYLVRIEEMRQSLRILRQAIDTIPGGPINVSDSKSTLPEKEDVLRKMEQLIHHFIITTEGIDAPAGEVYFSAENPKGELGFYINSKGGGVPYRLKIRAPSFVNLSIVSKLLPGHMVGDVVTILGSIDMVFGECDR